MLSSAPPSNSVEIGGEKEEEDSIAIVADDENSMSERRRYLTFSKAKKESEVKRYSNHSKNNSYLQFSFGSLSNFSFGVEPQQEQHSDHDDSKKNKSGRRPSVTERTDVMAASDGNVDDEDGDRGCKS